MKGILITNKNADYSAFGMGNVKDFAIPATGRVLIDFGLTGRETPITSGLVWNNVNQAVLDLSYPAVWVNSPLTVDNKMVSGLKISVDKSPRGAFNSNTNANGNGATVAVGDYPLTATSDSAYIHSTSGIVTMTLSIPDSIKIEKAKIWGSRDVPTTDAFRNLQARVKGAANWVTVNQAGNIDYNNAHVFTNLIGAAQLEFQVATDNFGYIGVMDLLVSLK